LTRGDDCGRVGFICSVSVSSVLDPESVLEGIQQLTGLYRGCSASKPFMISFL